MSTPRHLLIWAPKHLGDFILARPSIHTIRQRFIGDHVTVIAPNRFGALMEGLAINTHLSLEDLGPLQLLKRPSAIQEPQSGSDPIPLSGTLLLAPNLRSALYAKAWGSPIRVGVDWDHRRSLLTHHLPLDSVQNLPFDRHQQDIYRILTTKFIAAMTGQGDGIGEAQLGPGDALENTAPAKRQTSSRSTIMINPHGRHPGRRWPLSHFSTLITGLLSRGYGVTILSGFGPEEEIRTRHLLDAVADPSIQATPPNQPLTQLMNALAQASVLITNDTGPAHLAAHLQIPTAVIYGATSPRYNAPRDAKTLALTRSDLDCLGCYQRHCAIGYICMGGLDVDMVLHRLLHWMGDPPSKDAKGEGRAWPIW